MDIAQICLSVFVPVAIFSLIIWILDKYEREPFWLLLLVFFWGAVPAIVVSIIAEVAIDVPLFLLFGDPSQLLSIALGAPVIEEIAKALALLMVALFFRREFDGVMDGIVYGAVVGFGFAMTENFFYIFSCSLEFTSGCEGLAFLRTVVFGLNHALFTGITGAGLGYALTKRDARRFLVPPLALWLAMLTHIVHNLAALMAGSPGVELMGLILAVIVDWGSVLLMGLVIFLAWQRERAWLETQLPEEIAQGLLTEQEFKILLSWRRRTGVQLSTLFSGGLGKAFAIRRRQALATELAFYKAQIALGEKADQARLTRLRELLKGSAQP